MSGEAKRIVVISDTHLGRDGANAATAEMLRPLWRDADQLVINGDVADLQDSRLRAKAARQVLRLQDLCERDNVELTLLSGNHDAFLTDRRHLLLRDGLIFITHGDVLHPSISPWHARAGALRKFNEEALRRLAPEERSAFAAQLAATQHASGQLAVDPLANRGKRSGTLGAAQTSVTRWRQAGAMLWHWHTLPKRAAEFMTQHAPDARFMIFGHMHRAGVWIFGEKVIINTGAYGFPLNPQVVVITEDRLTVRRVDRTQDGRFTVGNEAVSTHALPPSGVADDGSDGGAAGSSTENEREAA